MFGFRSFPARAPVPIKARHLLSLAQRRVSAWASVQNGPAPGMSPCSGPRWLAMACLQTHVEAQRLSTRRTIVAFLTHTWTRSSGPRPRRAGTSGTRQASRPIVQSSCVKVGNHPRDLFYYEVALLELETRARRTGRETSDCNSRERLGRALVLFERHGHDP